MIVWVMRMFFRTYATSQQQKQERHSKRQHEARDFFLNRIVLLGMIGGVDQMGSTSIDSHAYRPPPAPSASRAEATPPPPPPPPVPVPVHPSHSSSPPFAAETTKTERSTAPPPSDVVVAKLPGTGGSLVYGGWLLIAADHT